MIILCVPRAPLLLADAAVAPQLPALLSQMRAQLNTNLGHGELLSLLAAGLKDPDLIQLSRLPLSGDQAARRLDQIRAEPLLELWHQAQAPSANNPQVNVEGIEPISTNTAVERLQGAGLAAQADHPQRFSLRLVPLPPGSDRAS